MLLVSNVSIASHYMPPYPYIFHGPITSLAPIKTEEQLDRALMPILSSLCSAGRFNQSVRGRYFGVVLLNDKTLYYLGYANGSGFNLFDPEKKADRNNYYLFDYDGTGSCRVYSFKNG